MKKYLFVGDTHGDLDFLGRAADLAAENDAEIIQLGDWGFVWPRAKWEKGSVTWQVPQLVKKLTMAGQKYDKDPVVMRFIDGNHDHHTWLRSRKDTKLDDDGLVIYQPRGSVCEDPDGTRFLFVGGAPSIDWAFRTKGYSWWPDEECISDAEFEAAMNVEGPIHVLVTHDAPDFPPGFSPKGDPEFCVRAADSMKKVFTLIEKHQPPLHVHGHWHHRYQRPNGRGTLTVGVDCNWAKFNDSVFLWGREA